MNREEALERVRGILVEQLGVDEEQVTEDASFQADLDADSLDLVELIMELEDQFGLKISDEDAQKIETVGQAVDYVTTDGSSIRWRPRPGARRSHIHRGSPTARSRTNGWSSWATACWAWRWPGIC